MTVTDARDNPHWVVCQAAARSIAKADKLPKSDIAEVQTGLKSEFEKGLRLIEELTARYLERNPPKLTAGPTPPPDATNRSARRARW